MGSFQECNMGSSTLLAPGRSLNLSNKATIKLRVTKPYKQYESVFSNQILDKTMPLTIGNTYVVAYENAATTWGGKRLHMME